jgi:RNA polymerase sigma-70 factor (ECF subfamily)
MSQAYRAAGAAYQPASQHSAGRLLQSRSVVRSLWSGTPASTFVTKRSTVTNSEEETRLLESVAAGDQNALAGLFSLHRDRLWRMVTFRMDPRLHGRIDADDVLQEAWLSAAQRIDHFLVDASRSIFVWFRLITSQTLVDIHRRHLGTQKRNAGQEFSIDRGWASSSTSTSLSFHLLDHLTTPSEAALRVEMSQKLNEALGDMKDLDREVLALRHFEQLSNREAAQVLGISEQAASDRYIRALGRLKQVLTSFPGYLAE